MDLVVISPEGAERGDEIDVVCALFAAGLQRFHVRKPDLTRAALRAWLGRVPPRWCDRLVLHQHHDLAAEFGIGGLHWRAGAEPSANEGVRAGAYTSCSRHTLDSLAAALGKFSAVFFSPVFPSLSKPGYGPTDPALPAKVQALLAGRSATQRRTRVLALGGITLATLPRAIELGFDGAAVLGAVWQSSDPREAYRALRGAAAAAVPAGLVAAG